MNGYLLVGIGWNIGSSDVAKISRRGRQAKSQNLPKLHASIFAFPGLLGVKDLRRKSGLLSITMLMGIVLLLVPSLFA